MKCIIVILLSIFLSFLVSGCSLLGLNSKRAPEVVPSCFSDGENQASYCKSQRVNEDRRIVITRCIGTQNQEAKTNLRGKCVEKICSEGSNTDCQVRGEFAVLEQYADLATAKLFAADEEAQSKDKAKTKGATNSTPIATPRPSAEAASVPKKTTPREEGATESSMKIVLKPAKKSRSPASVKEAENGMKKVCVAKNETAAPEVLRGKCATRTCTNGKCIYHGRKAVFEWVSP